MNRSTEDKIIKKVIPLAIITGVLVLAVFYFVRNSEENSLIEQFSNISGLTAEELSFLSKEGFIQYQAGQGEELSLANLKSLALIEQGLDTPEERFEVLATKLDLEQNTYQLAFKLENKTNKEKEFILIPVSQPEQLEFKQITGTIKKEKIVKNNIEKEPLDKLYNIEKHKKELKPELAKAYQDIENNNYQAKPIKLILKPDSTLIAQSGWEIKIPNPNDQNLKQNNLQPVYFLIYGSAGGVRDELTILNVHSHPQAGDSWTVSFETKGTADLIITPTDRATIDDIDFMTLKCGGEKRIPQILADDVIFYPDWQCPGTGQITHLVNIAAKHTLKFQFSDQIAYAYNSPDTEILRPNATGDETNISFSTEDTHWEAVDEETADDDTTYVKNDSSTDFQRDLYNLPASSGSGTINKITVYFRCYQSIDVPDAAKCAIKSGTTVDESPTVETTGSWTTFSNEWSTNPDTTSAWTWNEIDSLQIGVSLAGMPEGKGISPTYCTQVYVEVDYTPAAASEPAKRIEGGMRLKGGHYIK